MNGSLVKYLIGSTMVKYETMDEMFKNVNIKPDQVVFHLDAWHIFKRFFRNKSASFFTTVPEDVLVKEITIGFINIIGHYRKYIAAKLKKDNVFLIYFNPGRSIYHVQYDTNYKADIVALLYDKHHKDYAVVNAVLLKSLKMLMDLVTRIEGVYWLYNYGIDTPTAMCYTINTPAYRDSFHILFSREEQLGELVDDNCIQFIQRRKKDNSFLVCKSNFAENILYNSKNKGVMKHLSPKSLRFYFALNGCSDIGEKRIIVGTSPGVLNTLDKLYKEEKINDLSSIQTVMTEVSNLSKPYAKKIEANYDHIITRYKLYDLWLAARSISKTAVGHMFHAHFDLYDQETLEKLNEYLIAIDERNDIISLENLNMTKAVKLL